RRKLHLFFPDRAPSISAWDASYWPPNRSFVIRSRVVTGQSASFQVGLYWKSYLPKRPLQDSARSTSFNPPYSPFKSHWLSYGAGGASGRTPSSAIAWARSPQSTSPGG